MGMEFIQEFEQLKAGDDCMTHGETERLLTILGRLAAEADLKACEPNYNEAQKRKLTNRAKIFRLAQEEILTS